MVTPETVVLDADAIARALKRVALEIVERTRGGKRIRLVGIRTGGVPIARRLAAMIKEAEGHEVPVGAVDIALYRDDGALPDPRIDPSEIDFEIEGQDVVLVDDVLQTGRTVRAAITCLLDYGRPRRVWLAALCDRGGRELPFAPDFVGRSIEVPDGYVLDVSAEGDANDRAVLRPKKKGGS